MRTRPIELLVAAGVLPLAGCYTGMAVPMLTHCEPEWVEVRVASTHAADAALDWRSGCPGVADDGPYEPGPVHAGRLRIPPPAPRCDEIEVYDAFGRVPAGRFVRLAAGGTPPPSACTVLVRRDGIRRIVVVTRDGEGERRLATVAVPQLTTNPVPWVENVPLGLVVDALYSPAYVATPFVLVLAKAGLWW